MECFKKYLVETIGTFFFVFTIGSAILLSDNATISAITIGFALMVMVYAGGHISGGHYNPAVSLAAAIRGALEWKQVIPYWIAQCVGAAVASLFIMHYATEHVAEACPFSTGQIIIGEFLFTFALCYVVLQVATTKATTPNSYYGLAIGSTVTIGAFAVGGILCYGAFNPAVALGLGIMKDALWSTVALTIFINLIAGVVAGYTYKLVSTEE